MWELSRFLPILAIINKRMRVLKRVISTKLLDWKKSARRKPLILQGARQVGKTYILKEFAAAEYENYLYINFEENANIRHFFDSDIQPEKILDQLSVHFDVTILPEKTLIIFDEIQECPNALNSFKYFNEKANQYHIAAAGSLLGVKLKRSKGFPVGNVNFLTLMPMTFFEFLNAINKNKLIQFLTSVEITEQIPLPIHYQLIDLLKIYYYVGGMPEAVKSYINDKNFDETRVVHKEILNAYALDFSKHAEAHEVMKIMTIWNSIPHQLGKENKKFIFSAINKSARAREYESSIQWLSDAGMIHKAYNLSVPKIPLPPYGDNNAFKIYMLDVGLLSTMSQLPKQLIVQNHQLFSEFKGALTENFVAQEMMASFGESLYYWSSENKAEVDFIFSKDLEIYPVEVKSGLTRHSKSLKTYNEKYHPAAAIRLNLDNFKKDANVINCPLYLVSQLPRLYMTW
jgi:hypothetical protein